MRFDTLEPVFVEILPQELDDGVLYVSMMYSTVIHRCACGCGHRVVTPLSPTDWRLMFDGEAVTLSPSVGSWSLPCQSHYWIDHNRICWPRQFTHAEIETGRRWERLEKQRYYRTPERSAAGQTERPAKKMLWKWLRGLFS
jgi:hypothetical protein